MEETIARKAIVEAGSEIFRQGLVHGTGGNISVRVGYHVLCTPTGSSLGSLSEEELSLVTIDGERVCGPKPTKELLMHLAVYRARSDITAVVHTHSIYATTYACCGTVDSLVPIYVPSLVTKVGNVKLVPYRTPGTQELADLVSREILCYNALLLENHGVLLTGKTLKNAVIAAFELEENLKIHFLSQQAARPLREEWVKSILDKYS